MAATKKAPQTGDTVTKTADQDAPVRRKHDVGRLEYIDPRTLVLDPFNHRRADEDAPGEDFLALLASVIGEDAAALVAVEPDADTLASVETIGIQTPLMGRTQPDERTLGVIAGQRRWLAALVLAAKAVAAGEQVPEVPILVRDDLVGADDQALVRSMVENLHRRATTARDDVHALQQLALMDVTPARLSEHARTLGRSVEEIKAAPRAAKLSAETWEAGTEYGFDVFQLADLADLDADSDAVWTLSRAAQADHRDGGRGHWAHAVAQLRQQREDRERCARAEAELTAAGVAVLRRLWNWRDSAARPLADLTTGLGEPLDPEVHQRDCPGRAAYLNEDGTPVWMCAAWADHGHKLGPDAPPDSVQESAADTAAQRRRTIAYNKAWRAAREVREAFLVDLVARKDCPKPVWDFVLDVITGTPYWYARLVNSHRTDVVARYLGVKDPNQGRNRWEPVGSPFQKLIGRTAAARRGNVLLAHVAAAAEGWVMRDEAWRTPDADVAAWLLLLKGCGYTLSEVEEETLAAALAADAGKPGVAEPPTVALGEADTDDSFEAPADDSAPDDVFAALGVTGDLGHDTHEDTGPKPSV